MASVRTEGASVRPTPYDRLLEYRRSFDEHTDSIVRIADDLPEGLVSEKMALSLLAGVIWDDFLRLQADFESGEVSRLGFGGYYGRNDGSGSVSDGVMR